MEVSASSQNAVLLHSKISKLKHKLLTYLPSAWSLSEKKTRHKLLGFFGVLFVTQLEPTLVLDDTGRMWLLI